MLNVSPTAKVRLQRALEDRPQQDGHTFRLIFSSSEPKAFQIGLDKERDGDQIVKSNEGKKLLLVGADLAAELDGWEFDYQETPQGEGFTVSQPSMGS